MEDIAKYVVLSKSIFSPVLLFSRWKLLGCVTDSGPRIKTFIKYVEIYISDTINYTAKNAMPVYCPKFWETGISLFSAAEETLASISHLVMHDIIFYIDTHLLTCYNLLLKLCFSLANFLWFKLTYFSHAGLSLIYLHTGALMCWVGNNSNPTGPWCTDLCANCTVFRNHKSSPK